jgi:hypothetical protein
MQVNIFCSGSGQMLTFGQPEEFGEMPPLLRQEKRRKEFLDFDEWRPPWFWLAQRTQAVGVKILILWHTLT